MKKLTILVFAAFIISISSCRKCWECTTTYTTTIDGELDSRYTITQSICDNYSKEVLMDNDTTTEESGVVSDIKTVCVK